MREIDDVGRGWSVLVTFGGQVHTHLAQLRRALPDAAFDLRGTVRANVHRDGATPAHAVGSVLDELRGTPPDVTVMATATRAASHARALANRRLVRSIR